MSTIKIQRTVYDAMIAHVVGGREFESCGMLAGKGGIITSIYPATNVAENKGTRYEIDPLEIKRILYEEIEDNDLEHLGIYHSHPFTRAYPSHTDIRWAYNDVPYFIISLIDYREPDVRAFHIKRSEIDEGDIECAGEVSEASIQIIEA